MVKETEIEAKAENFRDRERQSEAERQSKTEKKTKRQTRRGRNCRDYMPMFFRYTCEYIFIWWMLVLMVKKQNGEELNREIEK